MIGHTGRQAERLHRKIDLHIAKIADSLGELHDLVPDHRIKTWSTDRIAEEVMEIGHELHAVVDRRRR